MDDAAALALAGVAGAAGAATSVGYRAAMAGHAVQVEHSGRRFRVVCSCGWKTPVNWSRKLVMQATLDHVQEAVSDRRVATS